jgi:hypothetical protein
LTSFAAQLDTKEEKQGPVHVEIEEKMNIQFENDGGLQSLTITGSLSVHTNDTSLANVSVSSFLFGSIIELD